MKTLLKWLAIVTIVCGCAGSDRGVSDRVDRLEVTHQDLNKQAQEIRAEMQALAKSYPRPPAKPDTAAQEQMTAALKKQEENMEQIRQALEGLNARLQKAEERTVAVEKGLRTAQPAQDPKAKESQQAYREELDSIRADLKGLRNALEEAQKPKAAPALPQPPEATDKTPNKSVLEAIAGPPPVGPQASSPAKLSEADLKTIEAYRKALRMYPDNANAVDAQCEIADIYRKAGMLDEALAEYRKAIETYPNHPRCDKAYVGAGETLLAKGQFDEAKDLLQTAVHGYPASPLVAYALLAIARCYRDAKQWDEAVKRYGHLIEAYPKGAQHCAACLELGHMLYALGRHADALPAFERAATSAMAPADASDAKLMAGRCRMMLGDYDKARQGFHTVSTQFKSTPTGVDAKFAMAESYYREGKFLEAAQAYRKTVEEHPADRRVVPALLLMADSYLSSNLYDDAIEGYRKVLTICVFKRKADPALYDEYSAQAQIGMGRAFYEKEDYAAASRALQDLMSQFQKSRATSWGAFLLADTLRKQQKFDEAVRAYDRAIEQGSKATPPASPIEIARACFWRGDCHQRKGRLPEAVSSYQEAAQWAQQAKQEEHGSDLGASALINRAVCLAEMNKPQEAIAQYKDVMEQFPNTTWAAAAAYQMGRCHESLGSDDAAIKTYAAFTQKYAQSDDPEIAQLVRQATWHAQRLDWSMKHRPQFQSAAPPGERQPQNVGKSQ